MEAWKNGDRDMYNTKGQSITAEIVAFKNGAPMSKCESEEGSGSSNMGTKKSNDVRKQAIPSGDVRSVFPLSKPANSPAIRAVPTESPTPVQPTPGKYVPPHLRKK